MAFYLNSTNGTLNRYSVSKGAFLIISTVNRRVIPDRSSAFSLIFSSIKSLSCHPITSQALSGTMKVSFRHKTLGIW